MDKMIAFCGLTCTECPAFIATQKNDDKQREKSSERLLFQKSEKIFREEGFLSYNSELYS